MNRAIEIFLFLVCLCSLVRSQTAEDSIKYYYGPVTVLGTHYPVPWLQVPFSLNYIQQKDLTKSRGYGLDEVLSGIPGVLVQSRAGGTDVRMSIRGFGARGAGQRSNAGTSRGVRVLTDGFPETEPDGRTSFDMIDISGAGAIEVMRSNASSTHGNASGGVINIMSNTMFESPFASATESFGSFGFRKEMVNAGAMLGSGRMFLSMSNSNFEGWRAHSRSAQTLLNTGIVAQLGERTKAGLYISGTSNVFHIPGALTQAQYDSSAQQADSALFIKRDERRNNRLARIGVTASHEIDDNNMFSASAFTQAKYLERSERGQYRQFNRYHIGGSAMYRHTCSFNETVRNTLLLGTDEAYQDGTILFYNRYNLLPTVERGSLRDNKKEGANNLGIFLQDEVNLDNNWIILLGARYDNVTYSYESNFDTSVIPVTKSFKHVTPKAGITYRVSPTQSIYASLGGGVEVPAGNETDSDPLTPDAPKAINPLLDPITSTTIEVGTKQILALGGSEPVAHLTYDVAAYWLQVNNDIIPYSNGTLFLTAGRTERMGLEVGGNLQFTNGLSASVAITASSNKYKEYIVDSVHYDTSKAGHLLSYANNKVVGVPDVYFTIGLQYTSAALKGLFVRVDLQSVGKYYADDANSISVPSYTILNAGIGVNHLRFENSGVFVNAFVGMNNLTDVKYIGSAWLNPDRVSGRPVFIEPGLPQNFFGSLSLGWDF